VRDDASGLFFHISCKPGAVGSFAALFGLEGMGA
jgi:hypothetical protein